MDDARASPKVQLIMNACSASKAADVVLAVGAKPCMGCTTYEEAALTASLCDVTVLNFGTPTTAEIANAVLSAQNVVVDPVGCGLETRGRTVKEWLERAAGARRSGRERCATDAHCGEGKSK